MRKMIRIYIVHTSNFYLNNYECSSNIFLFLEIHSNVLTLVGERNKNKIGGKCIGSLRAYVHNGVVRFSTAFS